MSRHSASGSRASTPLVRTGSRMNTVPKYREPIRASEAASALKSLRQTPKLAVVCAWIALFGDDLGLEGFDVARLESDLSGEEPDSYTPWVTSRLLTALASDRHISEDEYVPRLRREFLRRDPENSKLGNDKIPEGEVGSAVPWHALSVFDKMYILESLCNWLMWDGDRFKSILKTAHDELDWRVEPIGRDAQRNKYWLFDDGRLWIQRSRKRTPLSGPQSTQSKSRPLRSSAGKTGKAVRQPPARLRELTAPKSSPIKSNAKSLEALQEDESDLSDSEDSFKKGSTSKATSSKTKGKAPKPTTLGRSKSAAHPSSMDLKKSPGRKTRRSAAAGHADEVWEEIPEEWLRDTSRPMGEAAESSSAPPTKQESTLAGNARVRNGTQPQTDSDSELSDLESDSSVALSAEGPVETEVTSSEEEQDDALSDMDMPASWVEWEALCTHIDDWEPFLERLASSTQKDEKALYKFLHKDVVSNLRVEWEERRAERVEVPVEVVAPALRKRSNRILYKESELDEILRQDSMTSRSLRSRNNPSATSRRGNYSSGNLYQNLTEEERKQRIELDRQARQRERDERRQKQEEAEALEAIKMAEHHGEGESLGSPEPIPEGDAEEKARSNFAVEINDQIGSTNESASEQGPISAVGRKVATTEVRPSKQKKPKTTAAEALPLIDSDQFPDTSATRDGAQAPKVQKGATKRRRLEDDSWVDAYNNQVSTEAAPSTSTRKRQAPLKRDLDLGYEGPKKTKSPTNRSPRSGAKPKQPQPAISPQAVYSQPQYNEQPYMQQHFDQSQHQQAALADGRGYMPPALPQMQPGMRYSQPHSAPNIFHHQHEQIYSGINVSNGHWQGQSSPYNMGQPYTAPLQVAYQTHSPHSQPFRFDQSMHADQRRPHSATDGKESNPLDALASYATQQQSTPMTFGSIHANGSSIPGFMYGQQ